MDLRKLKKLIDLVQESGIAELEITEGEEKVRIVKSGRPAPEATAAVPAAPLAAAPAAPAAAAEPPPAIEGHIIKSPMVGTFYRAPSPDAEPFVSVGQQVEEDTVVAIIEAMKVMNEIKAETRGIIRRICVENATPVQFGQVLFELDSI